MSGDVNTVSPNRFIGKSQIVAFLKEKEAFDESSAYSLNELKNKKLFLQITILTKEKILVKTKEGHYYLKEDSVEGIKTEYRKFSVFSFLLKRNAFDKSSAISIDKLKNKNQIKNIALLIEEGVIAHVNDGHYYILVDSLEKFETQRKKFFFITIVSIIIPAVIFLLLGIAWILTAT